jgi:putative transposase
MMLGFWKALEDVWPKTRGQRCWVHKTANVLNKLPKSQQAKEKRGLEEIWMAETKKDALATFDAFVEIYDIKYEKAVECLTKDRDALLAFYDFPAEHWKHLRTSNPVESTRDRPPSDGAFEGVPIEQDRSRHDPQACSSCRETLASNQLPKVILGVCFTDGIEVAKEEAQTAA